jgi:hypothetical protein
MPGEVRTDGLQEVTRRGVSRGDCLGRDLNGQLIFAELDGESSEQMEFNHQPASSSVKGRGRALRASGTWVLRCALVGGLWRLGLIAAEMDGRLVASVWGVQLTRQDVVVSAQINRLVTHVADQSLGHRRSLHTL